MMTVNSQPMSIIIRHYECFKGLYECIHNTLWIQILYKALLDFFPYASFDVNANLGSSSFELMRAY